MDFSRFSRNAVTIRAVRRDNDSSSDPRPVAEAGTDLMASVQMHSVSRVLYNESLGSEGVGSVFFHAEPIDASSTRDYGRGQRLQADDEIDWRVDPADPTTWQTFAALGPAIPEGGGTSAWRVDVKYRA
jgi:hypothetical protein